MKAKHHLPKKTGDPTTKYNQSSQCRTETRESTFTRNTSDHRTSRSHSKSLKPEQNA